MKENLKNVCYGHGTTYCISAVNTKGDQYFTSKSKYFDVIWLLKMTRKIMAGVDIKANSALVFHEQILSFYDYPRENGD